VESKDNGNNENDKIDYEDDGRDKNKNDVEGVDSSIKDVRDKDVDEAHHEKMPRL
jgi:hypothetical protein